MSDLKRFQIYPLMNQRNIIEDIINLIKFYYGYCNICGKIIRFSINSENLRENVICDSCKSTNRKRQIAEVILAYINRIYNKKFRKITDLEKINAQLFIYNTENNDPLHEKLFMCFAGTNYYIYSNYFGSDRKSGDFVNGILHQDLTKTSFEDDKFDIVITSDVLEHIPEPYSAFKEIYRILKKGGVHVFTVPFYHNEFLDEKRSILTKNGVMDLKPQIIHDDPGCKNGILVYQIFSLEMLIKLREIGFYTRMYRLYDLSKGILGENAIVFESQKI